VAALTDALKSADGLVRANAVEALGKIGDDAEAAVPAIAGLLKDPVTDVRQAAAAALVRGPNPIHAAPALSAALKDPDADVRLMATQALTRLRNAAEIAVPDLVLALRDTNKDVRAAAVVTLAVAGCGGEGTVSAITSLLKDARTSVRQAAALALRGCVITDAEISDLIDALKGPDAEVRALSIEALSRSPAYSDAAVSALADALTDPNEEVRLAAASAFRYRAMPTAAAPAIAAMLRAPDKRERLAAANAAIYFAQPGNNEFVSALINALKDNDKKVRVAAAQALRGSYTPRYQYEGGTMYSRPIYSQPIYSDPVYLPPPPSPPAYYTPHLDKEPDPEVEAKVLALLEALEDPDKEVREASIRSLTSFGPTAKIAVPSLSKKAV
jgi:HEAT repeat protein